MTDNTKYLVCDVCFNDQIIEDVNLLETCTIGKIVQGLWEDQKFYSAAMSFLKTKNDNKTVNDSSLNGQRFVSYHGLDSNVIRAYVAIRVLPNWKWLEFKDFIADFENRKASLTIGDVLGNLSNGAQKPILKIIPKSEMEADDQEVKTIVQELLTTKSLATLSAAGCPLSKGMMSLIGQDKYACRISYDKRERFVYWLCRQEFEQGMLVSHVKAKASPPMGAFKIAKSRVTFDPEGEIKKLEDWFDKNQRPNMEMIMEYTETLNKGRLGKSRRMLLPDSIAVWFKNRRARVKKEESASHEQILLQHIVPSHKLLDVVQQGYEIPTMVPLPVSERKKGSGSLEKVYDHESMHSVLSYATTETNIKQKIEGQMANVTQPTKNTSTDSNTILPCGQEIVLHWMLQNQNNVKEVAVDQEMVDSHNTSDNQGANSLENDDKKTGNQQITNGNQQITKGNKQITDGNQQITNGNQQITNGNQQITKGNQQITDSNQQMTEANHQITEGNQSSENGNMETGDESGIQVVENADNKNEDHNTIVTDSNGKLGGETNDNHGTSADMHEVCYDKFEESKTENQVIQGDQQDSGVSSLKRAREEKDEEMLDHHHEVCYDKFEESKTESQMNQVIQGEQQESGISSLKRAREETGEEMLDHHHAVCYDKFEESKTENQVIQGEQQESGVSTLKRAREETDEEMLDHHHEVCYDKSEESKTENQVNQVIQGEQQESGVSTLKCAREETGEEMLDHHHEVCYDKSEESKTENQVIQGEQQESGVSTLKRAREETDEEMLDHHHEVCYDKFEESKTENQVIQGEQQDSSVSSLKHTREG